MKSITRILECITAYLIALSLLPDLTFSFYLELVHILANLKKPGFRNWEGKGLDWHDVILVQETDLLTERNAGYCNI